MKRIETYREKACYCITPAQSFCLTVKGCIFHAPKNAVLEGEL